MSEPIIKVEKLGKKYLIGHQADQGPYATFRDRMADTAYWFKHRAISTLNRKKTASPVREEFWALQDLAFEVQEGDRVGIIGRNGAGKSTLLKLLSRITVPTTGKITLNGRVASLLEVGTGFHPELTGRENIYLNGAVLGMPRIEIKKKFAEIVAFAEIEQFLDTPVKRYSSGMYVRLAFAVAAHLEPDILVIDEVLAVGDAAFQKKCLGKMGEVSSREGRTVLFVSHNMLAVKNLCQRAIWLEGGKLKEDGPAGKVTSNYLQSTISSSFQEKIWENINTAPGNESVRIHRLRAGADSASITDPIWMQTPVAIEVEFWNLKPGAHLHITLHLITEENITAFTTGSDDKTLPRGLFRSVCHIPGNLLNRGAYRINLLVVRDLSSVVYFYEDSLSFEVLDFRDQEYGYFEKEDGVIAPLLEWNTECVEDGL